MRDSTEKLSGPAADAQESESTARREFLKKIGKAGVAVPAISLLLSANFQASVASADTGSGGSGSGSS